MVQRSSTTPKATRPQPPEVSHYPLGLESSQEKTRTSAVPRAKFSCQRPRAGTAPQVPEVSEARSVTSILERQTSQTVTVQCSPRATSGSTQLCPGSWKQNAVLGALQGWGAGWSQGARERPAGLPHPSRAGSLPGERRARKPIAMEGQGSLATTAQPAPTPGLKPTNPGYLLGDRRCPQRRLATDHAAVGKTQ